MNDKFQTSSQLAELRPWPFGPPLRGRADLGELGHEAGVLRSYGMRIGHLPLLDHPLIWGTGLHAMRARRKVGTRDAQNH